METPMPRRFLITLPAIFATASIFAALSCSQPARAQAGSYTIDPWPSMEAVRSFPRACAQQDLNVIALLEAHADASDLPSEVLGQAGLAQLAGRLACLAGRIDEGLLRYREALQIGPVRPMGTR